MYGLGQIPNYVSLENTISLSVTISSFLWNPTYILDIYDNILQKPLGKGFSLPLSLSKYDDVISSI